LSETAQTDAMLRNVALYPWFKSFQNLLFWQAVWFLYFQNALSAAEAIVLYAIYDITTTVLEVPSGYMSDRLGRRVTLITAALAGAAGAMMLAIGDSFTAFAIGQMLLGASIAFASGTDSALLYESLNAMGRADEVEAQELKAWRFTYVALAVSALSGGVIAMWSVTATFTISAYAMLGALVVVWQFSEPPQAMSEAETISRFSTLRATLREPVLMWIFGLSVLMYGFSHIPFVFGQPFIAEALGRIGLAAEAPLVSGAVSTTMMLVSVAVSLFALALRDRIGLGPILLLAFGMQIALTGFLALTSNALAIALLFLRMVPDALSRPFIQARIQPLLQDTTRATYMSLQSLGGRVLFAAALLAASGAASDSSAMSYPEIRMILGWFAFVGAGAFVLLAFNLRRVGMDKVRTNAP